MAWTSPRTWVAGETVTAALNNTHIRDNLKAIGDPWTAYTPSWTSTGTAPAIGNGTLAGRYVAAGKDVKFYFDWTAAGTTTYGTGSYRWTLPVTANISTVVALGGWVYGLNGTGYMLFPRLVTTTTFELVYHSIATAGSAGGVAAQTTPTTWASGGYLRGYINYEAA